MLVWAFYKLLIGKWISKVMKSGNTNKKSSYEFQVDIGFILHLCFCVL